MSALAAALLALVLVVGSVAWMGPAVAGLCAAMVAGFFLYLRTFERRMPAPGDVLPLYLAAIAWQLLHFAEEFATGFQRALPAVVGAPAWTDAEFVGFNMVHYTLFLVSAIAILQGIRPLTYFACFFVIAMLLNGVAHPVLALRDGGYFPGLATGVGSLVFGILLLRNLRPSTDPNGGNRAR